MNSLSTYPCELFFCTPVKCFEPCKIMATSPGLAGSNLSLPDNQNYPFFFFVSEGIRNNF